MLERMLPPSRNAPHPQRLRILYLRPHALERSAIAEYALDFCHALRALPEAGFRSPDQIEIVDLIGAELSETIETPADRRRIAAVVREAVERLLPDTVPEALPCLVHAELGHALHREFWALDDLQRLAPGVPTVATIHDPPALCGNPCRYLRTEFAGATPARLVNVAFTKTAETLADRKKHRAEQRIARRLDRGVALSRAGAAALAASSLFGAERTGAIPHVHPVPLPAPAPRVEDANRPLQISFFAFICPGKGIEELLDAFERVAAAGGRDTSRPPPVLCIFGGLSEGARLDAYLRGLRRRIAASPLAARIRFEPGYIDAAERDRRLAGSDILALPFRTVPGRAFSSSSALRAMGIGRPIVAARANTMDEILTDGETALLYREDNPTALAECLRRLIGSADLRHRLGAAARRQVETHHAPGAVARRLAEVYRKVLRRGQQ